MLTKIWEIMVRWRTWLANSFFALLLFVPDILNQPEVLAIIPANYSKYVVAAAFLINIWLRPRPAVMKKDIQP